MPFTNYSVNKMLDLFFGKTPYTPPSTLYLGFSTSVMTNEGTPLNEVVFPFDPPCTIRFPIDNNKTTFKASAARKVESDIMIEAGGLSGMEYTFRTLFISDMETGGNVLYYAVLGEDCTVYADEILKIYPGSLYAEII